MRTTLRLAFFAAAAALAACGGGGGSSSAPPVHPTPTPTPAAMGQAVITIDWPGASTASAMSAGQRSSHRAKASFISPGTAGVNIWVSTAGNAATFQTGIQNPCGSGSAVVSPSTHGSNVAHPASCSQTTTTVNVPIGANTFYAYSYDTWDSVNLKGKGNLLGATTSGTTITVSPPPATNTVTVTLSGVVSGLAAAPALNPTGYGPPTFPVAAGYASPFTNTPVNVVAYDATGNKITGAYANPLTVAFYDTHSQYSSSSFPATVVQDGTTVSLSFTGSNDCSAYMLSNAPAYSDAQVSGGGVNSAVFGLQPSNGGVANGPYYASNHWFGRVLLCWPAINSAATYYIYRSNTSGAEGSSPYATVNGVTYQDYSVLASKNYYYVVCTTSTYNGTPGPTNTNCTPELGNYSGSPSYPGADVTNLLGSTKPVYWFDANDTSSISGGTWTDKSGNSNNMTTSGFTTVSNAYNIPGRSALQSAAGNYGYVSTGALQASTLYPLTIFVVASQNAANGNNYERLISLGYGTDQKGFVGTYGATGATYPESVASFWGNTATSGYGNCNNSWCDTHLNGSSTGQPVSWTYGSSVNFPAVFDVVNDGSCPAYICGTSSGQGGPLAYFNGAVMAQDHNGTMTSTTGMYIGATYTGGSLYNLQYWNGLVDEIVVYNSPLTTAQRQEVEGYLACKWGAQYALPASHPYSTANGCP